MGAESGFTIGIGQRVTVRLAEAEPVTGGVALDLLEVDGAAMPRGGGGGRSRPARGKPVRRKIARAHKKDAKTRRKVTRSGR